MAYTPAKKHAPLDESVQIPAAIRAAAMRSDALHAQAYETEKKEEPKPGEEAPREKVGEGKAPESAKTPAPAPAAPEEGSEDWEHRYKSLKGRYDRQEDAMAAMARSLDEMRAQLARQQETQKQQPVAELQFKDITDKEREDYGEDFLDVAARAAASHFKPIISKLQNEVQELRGNVGRVAADTQSMTQAKMVEYLDGQMSNWRTINRDTKFLAWANLPDPLSGAIRLEMMRKAYEQGDAQRVLRFFQSFLSDEAASDPAVRAKPDDPKNKGKIPLAELAAPGRAKASAASEAPDEKEIITRSQIAAFYAGVQKGAYRGNEEEKNRLEAMIFRAEAEGRITD